MILVRFKHLVRYVFSSRYRELDRLRTAPRFQHRTTRVLGPELKLVDGPSFYWAHKAIFEAGEYEFRAATDAPLILDAGANIGLSVLYFKRLYPSARIIAFEPDPTVFSVLQQNIAAFGCADVTLVQKAVWKSDGVLQFNSEGADGGRLLDNEPGQRVLQVPTVRLREYLQQPVDFLKMDIEGAEVEVIDDCRDLLSNVRNLFVEYHSFADRPQALAHLLGVISGAGFRLHLRPEATSPRPFIHRTILSGMDMQLNIFAFRQS